MQVKSKVHDVKLGLGRIQTAVVDANHKLTRFGGLYKWWTPAASNK